VEPELIGNVGINKGGNHRFWGKGTFGKRARDLIKISKKRIVQMKVLFKRVQGKDRL